MSPPPEEARDVSCRALSFYLEWMDARRMPRDELFVGLPYPPEHYQNQQNWIAYATMMQIEARFLQLFRDEPDLAYNLGRSFAMTRGFGFMRVVVGGLLSPFQVYGQFPRMVPAFLFHFVDIHYARRGPTEAVLHYAFHAGYPPTAAFLETIRGILAGVPGMFNQRDAAVVHRHFDTLNHSFEITTATQGGLIERVLGPWRAFWYWFRNRQVNLLEAHTAVLDANRQLVERADQLAAAKTELDRKVHELMVLNSLATAATLELDPRRVARASSQVLASSLGNVPTVVLLVEGSPPGLVRAAAAAADEAALRALDALADPTDDRVSELLDAPGPTVFALGGRSWQIMPLTSHQRRIGVVGFGVAQPDELALGIAAQLSIALDNAQAHQHLNDLSRHMGLRVQERTAELEEARSKLADTVTSLEEAQRTRTDFLTGLSHDWGTPLTALISGVELMLPRAPRELVGELRELSYHARLIKAFTENLLDLAKAEGGRLQIQAVPVDLTALAAEVVTTLRPRASASGIHLAWEAPREPVVVAGDVLYLRRILVNLVANAIKYVNEGDHVVVTGSSRNGEGRIDVVDDGPGIPLADQARVFERFYRVQASSSGRKVDGSGLGLPMSREIAHLHGGDIELESTPGRGCRFRLRLPLSDKPAEPLPELAADDAVLEAPPPPREVVQNTTATTRVLVVEDNDQIRDQVARLLSPHHRVTTARDGDEGLAIALREQPDLILSDVTMPGRSGIELCQALRQNPLTQQTPIILLTAHHDPEWAVLGLRSGADDFVRKPYEAAELIARVEAQLRIRQLSLTLVRMEKRNLLSILGNGVSHELLNPLGALLNLLTPLEAMVGRLLEKSGSDAERDRGMRALMSIRLSAEKMERIVNTFLSFARHDDSVRFKEVDPCEGIETMLELARVRKDSRVVVHRDFRYREKVNCAPEMLDTVVVNLVINAIDAMGNKGEIRVSVDRVEDRLQVRVRDSGPGVPLELRERIFLPFFTTKGPQEGTGLGLAICRETATLLGGTLELMPDDGKGAEFVLDVPIPQRNPRAAAAP